MFRYRAEFGAGERSVGVDAKQSAASNELDEYGFDEWNDGYESHRFIHRGNPTPRDRGHQRRAEFRSARHADDPEGSVDVDVSRQCVPELAAADRSARGGQSLWNKLD